MRKKFLLNDFMRNNWIAWSPFLINWHMIHAETCWILWRHLFAQKLNISAREILNKCFRLSKKFRTGSVSLIWVWKSIFIKLYTKEIVILPAKPKCTGQTIKITCNKRWYYYITQNFYCQKCAGMLILSCSNVLML